MLDLSKLTPAPWTTEPGHNEKDERWGYCHETGPFVITGREPDTDDHFVCLARQAFDVMIRRGWTAVKNPYTKKWFAAETAFSDCSFEHIRGDILSFDTPYEALVEADKWYSEHVEKGR